MKSDGLSEQASACLFQLFGPIRPSCAGLRARALQSRQGPCGHPWPLLAPAEPSKRSSPRLLRSSQVRPRIAPSSRPIDYALRPVDVHGFSALAAIPFTVGGDPSGYGSGWQTGFHQTFPNLPFLPGEHAGTLVRHFPSAAGPEGREFSAPAQFTNLLSASSGRQLAKRLRSTLPLQVFAKYQQWFQNRQGIAAAFRTYRSVCFMVPVGHRWGILAPVKSPGPLVMDCHRERTETPNGAPNRACPPRASPSPRVGYDNIRAGLEIR